MYEGHWGGGMGCAGGFLLALLWVFAILGLFSVVRHLFRRGRICSMGETPTEILKRRYAKGEISREEFERARKDIEES